MNEPVGLTVDARLAVFGELTRFASVLKESLK